MFGHQIVLNFDKKGPSHKTVIGGIGSLMVQGFMCLYIYIRFKMFFMRTNDENYTEIGVADIDNDPNFMNLPYGDMDITVFQSLKFQRRGKGWPGSHNDHGIGEILMDDPNITNKLKPYIKIAYKSTDIDWTKGTSGEVVETYFTARDCRASDFPSKGTKGAELFKAWRGYSMICPDFEKSNLEDKTWKLKGDPSSFKAIKGEFVVERCSD